MEDYWNYRERRATDTLQPAARWFASALDLPLITDELFRLDYRWREAFFVNLERYYEPFSDREDALFFLRMGLHDFSLDSLAIQPPAFRRPGQWALRGSDMNPTLVQFFFRDRSPFHLAERVLTDHQRIAQDADELGGLDGEAFADLSPPVRDQLSRIFSKRRIMRGDTLDLFLHPEHESVIIYDAAALKEDDFMKIFQICPGVKKVHLTNANQFKDNVLQFVTQHPRIHIVHLRLDCANLVTKETWMRFFTTKGASLETLKLQWLHGTFDDEVLAAVVQHCPRLERIKLDFIDGLTGASMERLGELTQLKHLTWARHDGPVVGTLAVRRMIEKIGGQLETLALDKFDELDDEVLGTIHTHCRRLRKLRLTENATFTDEGFKALFANWGNPPLHHISFRMCRDIDLSLPVGNSNGRGFCDGGFLTMMRHSGHQLDRLHLTACRHISHDVFAEVFNGESQYGHLRSLDVSFCAGVDDMVLAGVFRSCPDIRMVWAFGCFEVRQVVVPPQAILLGRLTAEGHLVVDGDV